MSVASSLPAGKDEGLEVCCHSLGFVRRESAASHDSAGVLDDEGEKKDDQGGPVESKRVQNDMGVVWINEVKG